MSANLARVPLMAVLLSLQAGYGVLVDVVPVLPGAGVRIALRPELAAP